MDQKKQVNELIAALGGFAEMTHVYHKAMIDAGAEPSEAATAMNSFIFAFWHEQVETVRQKEKERRENE